MVGEPADDHAGRPPYRAEVEFPMPSLFQEAVRSVHVHYRKNIGACGPYALINVDFEPLPAGFCEFEFINLVSDSDLPPEFGAAAGEGIRRELAGEVGKGGQATLPARAVNAGAAPSATPEPSGSGTWRGADQSSGKWQATWRPGDSSIGTGSSCAQRGCAYGQRVWNTHPLWVRKLSGRSVRYWMLLSRFLMIASRWSTPLTARLPMLRLR
jgi:hypothetical protein